MGRGVPSPSDRGLGKRRKLPHGGAQAENGFHGYLRSDRSHLKHILSIFERWRCTQTLRGPGKRCLLISPHPRSPRIRVRVRVGVRD